MRGVLKRRSASQCPTGGSMRHERPFSAHGGPSVAHGHFTTGGMDDRIEATLPPVFRPKVVPRS